MRTELATVTDRGKAVFLEQVCLSFWSLPAVFIDAENLPADDHP